MLPTGTGNMQAKKRSGALKSGRWIVRLGSAFLAAVGVAVTANQLELSGLENQRQAGERAFFELLTNLGSESIVVRTGAIGRIPSVLRLKVPTEAAQKPWEGILFLLGIHQHPVVQSYHGDLVKVIRALVAQPKDRSDAERLEAEAIKHMLCDLGAAGWFLGQPRRGETTREGCLAWIWQNAPVAPAGEEIAYDLFTGGAWANADFSRYDLRRANFSAARLQDVLFSDSNLAESHFGGAVLDNVSFNNASLAEADFKGAYLLRVSFSGADLRSADFSNCKMSDVTWTGSRNRDRAIGLDSSQLSH